jgi:LDH2 family malate/lactate/ureidoglycolate dehydrogenase
MVQILAGALSGGSFSPIRKRTQKGADPDNIGHFFLAIDPKAFRPDGAFEDDVDAMIEVLHGARPVDPALPVLVAGDPEELARRERLQGGVGIPAALQEKIRTICARCGAAFLLS